MHLLLTTKHNQIIDGLLLATGQGTIRVAARGIKDTLELHKVGEDRWMTKGGDLFEIAAFDMLSGANAESLQNVWPTPKVRTAGSAYPELWN